MFNVFIGLIFLSISAFADSTPTEPAVSPSPFIQPAGSTPAEAVAAPATSENNQPVVIMKTSKGDIKIRLFQDKAPVTVENFLKYVDSGFYENTVFHRVIGNFMVQGGGFTSDMQPKPTQAPIMNEAKNGVSNLRGRLAMARTDVINSATSQFFINVVDNAHLDYRSDDFMGYGYCVFGEVIEGMDVVDMIRSVPTERKGPYSDVPRDPIEIIQVVRIGSGN